MSTMAGTGMSGANENIRLRCNSLILQETQSNPINLMKKTFLDFKRHAVPDGISCRFISVIFEVEMKFH